VCLGGLGLKLSIQKFQYIFVHILNQDLDFQHHMLWSFFFINKLRCEVIVCFVDIDGTVDHLCLKLSIHNVVENFRCYRCTCS